MPLKSFRFTGLIGGLYAAANVFDQPQGTVPRISNLVYTERGGLLTTDGTHVVSRPAPSPPPKGFISSGAISSSQPPAPTVVNSSAGAGLVSGAAGSCPTLSIDIPTPSGTAAGDVLIAVVLQQNKNFFSTSATLTPPSSDWVLGFYNGGFDTQRATAVYALSVSSALPDILTFTATPGPTIAQLQMTVTVICIRGANNANPLDNIGFTALTHSGGGSQLIGGITTLFLNDLILVCASPVSDFFIWGGVITPGTPAGTSLVSLFQSPSASTTMAVWSQTFVGPGFTGNYTSPTGWAGAPASSACPVIGIGAGFPNDGDIEGFEPTDDLTITPDPIITGSSTLLSAPQGMFFDEAKQLWIADAQSGNQGAVLMYKSPAQDSGNKRPDNVIRGSSAELNFPQDVVIDGANQIYVANYGTASQDGFVSIFAAGASGNVAPTTLISGTNTTLVHPIAVDVDGFGNVYVADVTQNAVLVFAAGEGGNIAPLRVISGSNTLIFSPQAIRFDSAGNLWIAVGKVAAQNSAYMLKFDAGSSGNATPSVQIESTSLQPITGEGGPTGISFDTDGNLFVSVYKNGALLRFNVGVSGVVIPDATITGWSNGPWGVAIPQ